MNNLAEVYRHSGSYSEAEPLMVKTLALRRRVLGDAHPHTHNTMNNLGIVYSAIGRLHEAERLLEEVLALRLRVLGERHPNTLMTMNNLAHAYRAQGKSSDAETMLVKAIQLERQVQGERHPDTRLLMSNLVLVYRLQGRLAEAKVLVRKALELDLATTGPDHPDTLRDLERLALIHHSERQYAEAEEVFTTVVDGRRKVLGDGHLETLIALISRGRVRLNRQNHVGAEFDFRLALDTFSKTSLDVWQRHSCESFLGTALAAQKKYSDAAPRLVAGHDGMVRFRAAMPVSEVSQIADAEESPRRALSGYRQPGTRGTVAPRPCGTPLNSTDDIPADLKSWPDSGHVVFFRESTPFEDRGVQPSSFDDQRKEQPCPHGSSGCLLCLSRSLRRPHVLALAAIPRRLRHRAPFSLHPLRTLASSHIVLSCSRAT